MHGSRRAISALLVWLAAAGVPLGLLPLGSCVCAACETSYGHDRHRACCRCSAGAEGASQGVGCSCGRETDQGLPAVGEIAKHATSTDPLNGPFDPLPTHPCRSGIGLHASGHPDSDASSPSASQRCTRLCRLRL